MEQNSESVILASYIPKLVRLADRNLSPKLRQKVNEEDITQTVLRSVIRKAREGQMVIEESEDFWRQLVAITLNKVRKKARYWKAGKRNISREQELSTEGNRLDQLAVDHSVLLDEPTEDDGKAFVETLELLTAQLDQTCQNVLALKLEGLSHLQIAERLEVSTRSVTRYLTKIKESMQQLDNAKIDD